MPTFAYGSPEQLDKPLPEGAYQVWDDVPELRVWGESPDFALRAATHELGRVATIGACFTDEESYANAVQEALENDTPGALTKFPGSYTTILIKPEGTTILKDVAGITPVYFSEAGESVVVSSQPSMTTGGSLKLSPERIAAQLALPLWDGSLSGNATCFEGVSRLEAGQALSITHEGATVSAYEPLNPDPALSLEQGSEQVRHALHESVAARMRSGHSVRSNLSGGKDSSSIVAMALQKLGSEDELPVYFMDDPDSPGGDRDYVDAYIDEEPRLKLTRINSHNTTIAPDMEAIPHHEDLALAVPPHRYQVISDIYAPSKRTGPGLHFSGNGGDEVMGTGSSHLPDLLMRGRVVQLIKEGVIRAKIRNVSPWEIWRDVASFAFHGVSGSIRKLSRQLRQETAFDAHNSQSVGTNPIRVSEACVSFLTKEARHAVADVLQERASHMDQARKPTLGQYLARERTRISAMGHAIEAYSVSSDSGVLVQAPLLDSEVVRAALAIDVRRKGDPYSFKPILEHAMQGILPDMIRNRNTKGIYDPHNARLHTESMRGLGELMQDSRLAKMGIIDPEKISSLLPLLASLPLSTIWAFERVMTAELWLRSLERSGLATVEPAYEASAVANSGSQIDAAPSQEFQGVFCLPDHVHAVASLAGNLTVFNRKTNKYHPLDVVQSNILRVFAMLGDANAVVDLLAQHYTTIPRSRLAADTHRTLHEFSAMQILEQSDVFAPQKLPLTAEAPRFVSSESKVSQQADSESLSIRNKLIAAVALTSAVAISKFAPHKRLDVLKRLQAKNTRQADLAEAQDILKAVQSIKYLGRLACLESSYAAALGLAVQRSNVDWHMGASFYPVGYHSWIEAAGVPVRTSTEGEVTGDFQSFFT